MLGLFATLGPFAAVITVSPSPATTYSALRPSNLNHVDQLLDGRGAEKDHQPKQNQHSRAGLATQGTQTAAPVTKNPSQAGLGWKNDYSAPIRPTNALCPR
ncbi:hypothetical protein PF005_g27330 [Phytophthora fragariae]|uniref:RxLR effector protein n=1 Tax=Phytophthora fragariae TaxID=53985 RepID=A0A6A3QTS0_9STRA|nr:hypothetical protein PF009_g27997 [Phytophthora fragariae]KAE8971200.1 hypothetical protein PF011_g26119 [Phytophthora fragariae]KAE9069394.1 hypothetical protein PF007_g27336 [Phytophthora fragariae]KAE9069550.1 hypothetical protein PF010_g26619 [Phytophthora fragariae]KAE9082438.1 hypothetical protein PF006_g26906 [Phytophthora fragariae]